MTDAPAAAKAVRDLKFEPPPECPKCDGLGFILNTRTAPRKCRTCKGTGVARLVLMLTAAVLVLTGCGPTPPPHTVCAAGQCRPMP